MILHQAAMFPFDAAIASGDDLLVLAAYAAAEEESRNAQGNLSAPDASIAQSNGDPDSAADQDESDSVETGASLRISRQVWVGRLRQIHGVPEDHMAPIHGRLIAHGLLQFQLRGQQQGVVYRLTGEGRKLLEQTNTADAEAA